MKRITKITLLAVVIATLFASSAFAFKPVLLQSNAWEPNTKAVINEMLTTYGKASPNYKADHKPYAAFDWDNTTAILDVFEQTTIYQLERLRLGAKPEQMLEVLLTGIPTEVLDKPVGGDLGNATIRQAATDAANAYAKLYAKGYVCPTPAKVAKMSEWQATDDWKEFATKTRWLYDAIGEMTSTSISYPWVTYLFTGMTPDEVTALSEESYRYHNAKSIADKSFWKKCKWTSPANYPGSTAGQLTIGYNQGITVSPELQELYLCLLANGIDVWVDTASTEQIIKAAANNGIFGIYCTGVVGMNNKIVDGKYTNVYDYDKNPQTEGLGKSLTILKRIAPKYNGQGPILCGMDSQGDFNFCTEFKDTKVVLILNRTRNDDAALVAAAALWQNKHRINLAKAVAMGDTRYCLQGRNENGGYLWAKPEVQRLGKDKETLLSDKGNKWLGMLEGGMSIKELINNNTKLKGKNFKGDGVGDKPAFAGYKTR